MKKRDFVGSGDTIQAENLGEFVGDKEMLIERRFVMSAKGTKQSSQDTKKHMKHGEEPREILLQMAWSAVETLLARGDARLFVGNGEVAVIFANTSKTDEGLVPTLPLETQ
jgi:hypothetical protein